MRLPLQLLKNAWKLSTGQALIRALADQYVESSSTSTSSSHGSGRPPSSSSSSVEALGAGIHVAGDDPATVEALGAGLHVAGGPVTAAAIGLKRIEPYGWLGALVAHGGACLSFEIDYMTKHHHILPNMRASWNNSGNPELHWKTDSLLTRQYQEWPCPVFPRTGPMFLQNESVKAYDHNGGDADAWRQACHHDAALNEVSWIIQWGFGEELRLSGTRTDSAPGSWGIRVDDDGYLICRSNSDDSSWRRVYPGRRVADWAIKTAWQVNSPTGAYSIARDRGLAATSTLLMLTAPGYASRAVLVPPYYRSSTKRLHDFYRRLARWYYTARWLVWAGEMLREHSYLGQGHSREPPSWWKAHALSWAVGVPGAEMSQKWHYDAPTDQNLHVEMTQAQVYEILRLVVAHTPPPGSEGATGQQIAPAGAGRSLCDIPEAASSIAPPIDLIDDAGEQWWATYAVAEFKAHEDYLPWLKVVGPIIDGLISICGSGAGGAISTGLKAATTALNAVQSALVHVVATYALQAVVGLGRGKMISSGDVVGLVGNVISATGITGDVLKNVPDDVWTALKTAGAAIPQIKGDWQEALPRLQELQSAIVNAQDYYHWNYADAAWGGLGLSQYAKDVMTDAGMT